MKNIQGTGKLKTEALPEGVRMVVCPVCRSEYLGKYYVQLIRCNKCGYDKNGRKFVTPSMAAERRKRNEGK